MQIQTITGERYNIRPRCNRHLLVSVDPPEAPVTRSGIFLPEPTEHSPSTIAKILEVPYDHSLITRLAGFRLLPGDDVLFARYATEKVVTQVAWEDVEVVDWTLTYMGVSREDATRKTQVYTLSEVHVIDVESIEALLDPTEDMPRLPRLQALVSPLKRWVDA